MHITRRLYSAARPFLPPNIATTRITATGTVSKSGGMANLVEFYQRIPKGNTPSVAAPKNILERYSRAYLEDSNVSLKPIVHWIVAGAILGYALDYHYHLKNHKNKEHH